MKLTGKFFVEYLNKEFDTIDSAREALSNILNIGEEADITKGCIIDDSEAEYTDDELYIETYVKQ